MTSETGLEVNTLGSQDQKWPETPYKGFSYYGPADLPLFAGRDQEIIQFARLISPSETRFTLLYGPTGCGKSSFLRAGVIPFLESGLRGFRFHGIRENGENKAIFIRSLETPLQSVAREVFRRASEAYYFTSPEGEERIDLSPALSGRQVVNEFVDAILEEPERLIDALKKISILLPHNLVLVIDQGEEALNSSDERAEADQVQYFKFLSMFSRSTFPVKLIIALREDFLAPFEARLDEEPEAQVGFGEYSENRPGIINFRLKHMPPDQMVEAIRRPTQHEAIPGYGPPPYDFVFADRLPELIVQDVVEKTQARSILGSGLPVLQAVCGTLFENAVRRAKPWVITYDDYKSLGEIESQVNDYLDRVLLSFCSKHGVSSKECVGQIIRWKDILASLASVQPNNTVMSNPRTREELHSFDIGNAPGGLDELLRYLASRDVGVLTEVQIWKPGSINATEAVSLKHDAISLALARWRVFRQASRGAEQSSYLTLLSALMFVILYWVCLILVAVQVFQTGGRSLIPILTGGVAGGLFLTCGLSAFWARHSGGVFAVQLLSVSSMPLRLIIPKRLRLDQESLSALERNPLFRLHKSVNSRIGRLYQMARKRLSGKPTDGAEAFQTDVHARLDRLPMARFHRQLIAILGFTWVLDGLEVTSINILSAAIRETSSLGLSPREFSYTVSAYVSGAIVGALVFGWLTDRFGRRKLFRVTVTFYVAATIATAFSWDFWSLLLLRSLIGLGIGGEYAVVNATIQEFVPAKSRGAVTLFVNGCFWVGALVASLYAILFLGNLHLSPDIGWRLVLAISGATGLILLFLRRLVPESPRWLVTHGRPQEAENIISGIEHDVARELGTQLDPPKPDKLTLYKHTGAISWISIRELLKGYRQRIVFVFLIGAAQAFFYNGVYPNFASILKDVYMITPDQIPVYMLPIAAGNFAGPLVLGWLFDSVGRREMMLWTFLLSGVIIIAAGLSVDEAAFNATGETMALTLAFFFASAAASSAYLAAGEAFPSEIRAVAIAIFFSLATGVAGIVAPALFGMWIELDTRDVGYFLCGMLMVGASIVARSMGVIAERRGLEEIAPPLAMSAQSRPYLF